MVCRTLKLTTIKQYVRDVACFLSLFTASRTDYRYTDSHSRSLAPALKGVFDEIQKYESLPDKREPYTFEMQKLFVRKNAEAGVSPDSLSAALQDWFECGLFAGFRLSEWAQANETSTLAAAAKNAFGESLAFTISDIQVQSTSGARLTGHDILSIPVTSISKMWVTWRWQKNQSHGENKLFTPSLGADTATEKTSGYCFIRPMYRILQRLTRLCGTTDHCTPLSVYRHSRGHLTLINNVDIREVMRDLGSEAYSLDPIKHKTDLMRWSSHSLRVGACVILHSMGFDGPQIQHLLRWRSLAFMDYLRNSTTLSNRQREAFDKLAAMPHF